MLTAEESEVITLEALLNAFDRSQLLGKEGIRPYGKNKYGETRLRVDWESEEAIIQTLRKYKLPITVVSEEHDIVVLGNELLGILDGKDGSGMCVEFWKGNKKARFGTMFAIYRGRNPCYSDYITSGIMEDPNERLFIATKGKGAFATNVNDETGTWIPLHVSNKRKLDRRTKILVDYYYPSEYLFHKIIKIYVDSLEGFDWETLRCSAAHYIDLITGKAHAVLETTRKDNLEIAVAYPFIAEAGGVMVTNDGKDIGNKYYSKFGRKKNEHLPVLSATNMTLARRLAQKINLYAPSGI